MELRKLVGIQYRNSTQYFIPSVVIFNFPAQRSRYISWATVWTIRGLNPDSSKRFVSSSKGLYLLCGPPTLLFNKQ
jgi:hypothetical protein